MKKLTTEEFIKRAIKIHGDMYDYSEVNYSNSRSKVKIVCKIHGAFLQTAGSHIFGKNCPDCAGQSKMTTDKFISKSNKMHNNKYDYSETKYVSSKEKVNIICSKHGKFLQLPYNHLSGRGCSKCFGNKKIELVEFIERAKEKYGDKYDYSSTKFFKNKVSIICKKHGIFFQSTRSHLRGCECPKCYGTPKSNTEEFILKAKKIHGDKYEYGLVNYNGNKIKVKIKCTKHGIFTQKPNAHLVGHGCPHCKYEAQLFSMVSKAELEYLDYLKIKNRQKYISGYYVDGVDGDNKIIYEFLGDYWHGNPEKFKQNHRNKSLKKTFGQLYEETFHRFDNLKSKGYTIKYIWENDWNQFKRGADVLPKIITY